MKHADTEEQNPVPCGKCGHQPMCVRSLKSGGEVSIGFMCINPACGKLTEEQKMKRAIQQWNQRQ